MARYLLDTTVIIDFARNIEPVSSRLAAWIDAGEEVAVTAVQVVEFLSGTRPVDRTQWASFFDGLDYWEITSADAFEAGIYRYDFARVGIQLSMTDTLTAAVARARAAIVVTENIKHFPMADIEVISLRV